MVKRTFMIVVGLLFALGASQAPEFMQQYSQRLGGWLDSYNKLVADLDARAAEYKMTREQYIAALRTSPDPKVVAEADNIAQWPVIQQRLADAQTALDTAPVWQKGIVFIRTAERPLLQATYGAFKPAAPATPEGAGYGIVGLLVGLIAGNLVLLVFGLLRKILGMPFELLKRVRGGRKLRT